MGNSNTERIAIIEKQIEELKTGQDTIVQRLDEISSTFKEQMIEAMRELKPNKGKEPVEETGGSSNISLDQGSQTRVDGGLLLTPP